MLHSEEVILSLSGVISRLCSSDAIIDHFAKNIVYIHADDGAVVPCSYAEGALSDAWAGRHDLVSSIMNDNSEYETIIPLPGAARRGRGTRESSERDWRTCPYRTKIRLSGHVQHYLITDVYGSAVARGTLSCNLPVQLPVRS